MRRSKRFLSLIAGFVAITGFWGCGSGGSQVAEGGSASSEQNLTFGELSVRVATLNPPVFTSGTGTSATGFTGQITSAEVRPLTSDLDSSFILISKGGNAQSGLFATSPNGMNSTQILNSNAGGVRASWSPDGNRIATASGNGAQAEIFVMNTDGSNRVRLTNNTFSDTSPAWSPDGTKIAFTSNRDGNNEIYVMNTDGSNLIRLTNNTFSDTSPAWSPDGSRVVFTSDRDGNDEIYTTNLGLTLGGRLTNNTFSDTLPAWSPDGRKIAFTSNRDGSGTRDIYVMNADGFRQTRLTVTNGSCGKPTWSPDNSKIAYSNSNNIFVVNTDGSNTTNITNGDPSQEIYFDPSWSPFPSRTPLIGVGGRLGTVATGIIYATGNHHPSSVVTWDNSDFTALKLTALGVPNSNSDVLAYDLEGGSTAITLTQLSFMNFNTVKATSITTSTPMNGVLIYIDSWTGYVTSVLPFNAPSRSVGKPSVKRENGTIVARGSFAGVWNAEGRNLAPQGASTVRLDSKTGKVLGIETGGSR